MLNITVTADLCKVNNLFAKINKQLEPKTMGLLEEPKANSFSSSYSTKLARLKIKAGYSQRQSDYLANAIQLDAANHPNPSYTVSSAFAKAEGLIDKGVDFEEIVRILLGN